MYLYNASTPVDSSWIDNFIIIIISKKKKPDNFIIVLITGMFIFISKCFLYQDTHNQAGIAHNGGIVPLLKLLDSKNESLQHNAAFALYGLADNEVKFVS